MKAGDFLRVGLCENKCKKERGNGVGVWVMGLIVCGVTCAWSSGNTSLSASPDKVSNAKEFWGLSNEPHRQNTQPPSHPAPTRRLSFLFSSFFLFFRCFGLPSCSISISISLLFLHSSVSPFWHFGVTNVTVVSQNSDPLFIKEEVVERYLSLSFF